HWLNGSAVATSSCPVSVTNGYVNQTMAYLETGMVSQATDGCGHATNMQYAATPYAGAYLTSTCNALSQCTTTTYNLNPGLVASVTAPNNQATHYTYDDIGGITTVGYPDQGQTSFYCPDCVSVGRKRLLRANPSVWTDQYFHFDGLGRRRRNETV